MSQWLLERIHILNPLRISKCMSFEQKFLCKLIFFSSSKLLSLAVRWPRAPNILEAGKMVVHGLCRQITIPWLLELYRTYWTITFHSHGNSKYQLKKTVGNSAQCCLFSGFLASELFRLSHPILIRLEVSMFVYVITDISIKNSR